MHLIIRGFYLFVVSELFIAFLANLVLKNYPPIPGDIFVDRYSIKLYIPFVSGLLLAIILSFVLNYLK